MEILRSLLCSCDKFNRCFITADSQPSPSVCTLAKRIMSAIVMSDSHARLADRFAGGFRSRRFEPRPNIQHVVFDFDGTLSLVREGWPGDGADV